MTQVLSICLMTLQGVNAFCQVKWASTDIPFSGRREPWTLHRDPNDGNTAWSFQASKRTQKHPTSIIKVIHMTSVDPYRLQAIVQVFDSFVYKTNQNRYLIQWTINNCKWIIESLRWTREPVQCDLWMNRLSQFCVPDKQERDRLKQMVNEFDITTVYVFCEKYSFIRYNYIYNLHTFWHSSPH